MVAGFMVVAAIDLAVKTTDESAVKAVDNNSTTSSPRFFVSDTTLYVNQARDLALADAHARAESLAAAYGMTVGDPLYLSDTAYRSGDGGGGGGGGPVIIPGTESVSFSVNVTFELK